MFRWSSLFKLHPLFKAHTFYKSAIPDLTRHYLPHVSVSMRKPMFQYLPMMQFCSSKSKPSGTQGPPPSLNIVDQKINNFRIQLSQVDRSKQGAEMIRAIIIDLDNDALKAFGNQQNKLSLDIYNKLVALAKELGFTEAMTLGRIHNNIANFNIDPQNMGPAKENSELSLHYYKKALEAGEDEAKVGIFRTNCTQVRMYHAEGQYDRAHSLLRDLEDRLNEIPKDDVNLMVLNSAYSTVIIGDYLRRELDQTIRTLERAIDVLKQHFGYRVELSRMYTSLAIHLLEKGDVDKALKYALENVQLYEKTYGGSNQQINLSFFGPAETRFNKGQYEICRDYCEKGLDILEKSHNTSVSIMLNGYILLAKTYHQLGNDDKSKEIFKRGKKLLLSHRDEKSIDFAHYCLEYGNILITKENTHSEAKEYIQKALDISLQGGEKGDILATGAYLAMVKLISAQGKADEGTQWVAKVLEFVKNKKNIDMSLLEQVYAQAAHHYLNIKRYNESIECYKKVIEVSERSAGKEYLHIHYTNIGHAYLLAGNKEEAITANKKALECVSKYGKGDAALTLQIWRRLSGILHEMGRTDEAKEFTKLIETANASNARSSRTKI